MSPARNYRSPRARLLDDSPLRTTRGKAVFGAVLLPLSLAAAVSWSRWLAPPGRPSLLLLVAFAPAAVSGARDGLVYGALGGFGFNIVELAVYAERGVLQGQGPEAVAGQLSRLGILGVDNHVVWSALVGPGSASPCRPTGPG